MRDSLFHIIIHNQHYYLHHHHMHHHPHTLTHSHTLTLTHTHTHIPRRATLRTTVKHMPFQHECVNGETMGPVTSMELNDDTS